MILGLKCEGCRRWTRLTGTGNIFLTYSAIHDTFKPYYCDECQANVTFRETYSKITLAEATTEEEVERNGKTV